MFERAGEGEVFFVVSAFGEDADGLIENGAGLAFYDFPGIADHAQFKDDYRARLDALPLDKAAGQSLIDEANHAFALNRGVFEGMLTALPTAS